MTPVDAIVLFAHGSRDPLWRAPMEAVAQCIRTQQPNVRVHCAYLELCAPDLPAVATEIIAACAYPKRPTGQKALKIRIIPMFLGMGKHAREDLPELVSQLRAEHPTVQFEIRSAVGEDPRVIALLADLALH